nr:MAG TPA: repressor protein CI [Caudoviricetes sp.]
MSQVDEILARVRFSLGVKNDTGLAEILEIPYKTLDGWKTRGAIPRARLLEISAKLNVTPEYLESGINISNNTNSVVVNGSNNGSIVNGHQVKVSDEFMEFAELFKKYGNSELLKQWTESLLKIKEVIKG